MVSSSRSSLTCPNVLFDVSSSQPRRDHAVPANLDAPSGAARRESRWPRAAQQRSMRDVLLEVFKRCFSPDNTRDHPGVDAREDSLSRTWDGRYLAPMRAPSVPRELAGDAEFVQATADPSAIVMLPASVESTTTSPVPHRVGRPVPRSTSSATGNDTVSVCRASPMPFAASSSTLRVVTATVTHALARTRRRHGGPRLDQRRPVGGVDRYHARARDGATDRGRRVSRSPHHVTRSQRRAAASLRSRPP